MEHQDLPAKTPARQFKAIGIVTHWITAFRPWLLHPIGREASQISCAFAVVKEQFKMPLFLRRCFNCPQFQMLPGHDIGVADTGKVALGAVVSRATAPGVSLVLIVDLLAVGVEAFLKQPLGNMGRRLRIGDAGHVRFAKQVQVAVCALDQPEPCGV